MNAPFTKAIVLVFLLNALLQQIAYGAEVSEKRACRIVVDWLEQENGHSYSTDDYFCLPQSKPRQYYVFRMAAKHPAPPDAGPDWIGSNLMGYYAIRRKDGKIFEWDVGNQILGKELKVK